MNTPLRSRGRRTAALSSTCRMAVSARNELSGCCGATAPTPGRGPSAETASRAQDTELSGRSQRAVRTVTALLPELATPLRRRPRWKTGPDGRPRVSAGQQSGPRPSVEWPAGEEGASPNPRPQLPAQIAQLLTERRAQASPLPQPSPAGGGDKEGRVGAGCRPPSLPLTENTRGRDDEDRPRPQTQGQW